MFKSTRHLDTNIYSDELKLHHIHQGFSKSTIFKGPNLNFHQCQSSGPEQLVFTQLVFNKHTVAYITCITNKHLFFIFFIKCSLHSKYIHNKSKSGKIHLSVCNRGRPTRVFLWPMPMFRNQGSRWPILDTVFFWLIHLADFLFSPLSPKRVWVNVYCRVQDGNSSSSSSSSSSIIIHGSKFKHLFKTVLKLLVYVCRQTPVFPQTNSLPAGALLKREI